jgi:hypothetical protein
MKERQYTDIRKRKGKDRQQSMQFGVVKDQGPVDIEEAVKVRNVGDEEGLGHPTQLLAEQQEGRALEKKREEEGKMRSQAEREKDRGEEKRVDLFLDGLLHAG